MGEDPGKWELSPPSPPPWELGGFSNPSLKDWSNFLKGAVGECVAVGAVIQNSGPGTFCSPLLLLFSQSYDHNKTINHWKDKTHPTRESHSGFHPLSVPGPSGRSLSAKGHKNSSKE